MNEIDDEVRDLLQERARDVPPTLDVPRSLTTRVHRRITLNALAVTITLVVVAAGAFGGLRALRSQPSDTFYGGKGTPCASAHLRATVSMEGAPGSREGSIDVTNTSEACSLKGTPTLTLLDQDLDPITSGITFESVPAAWEVGGLSEPQGWPVVDLATGESASVRVRWSNWCADGDGPPLWRIAIPASGEVDVEGFDAMSVPPCNGPDVPSTIEVGPFEPHDTV